MTQVHEAIKRDAEQYLSERVGTFEEVRLI